MWLYILAGIGGLLVAVVVYDLVQTRHAVLRNFPIIGHFRYLFEAVGPEFRQYIVTDNDEERPFSRDERRWVYASAKKENNYFGYGTDNDLEQTPNHLVVKHSAFPLATPLPGQAGYDPLHPLPCAKVLGGARGRAAAFRPASIVNLSGMSFGSLSAHAVEALNRGAALCGCLHNTGEGGISRHHEHGGELVYQIGTGYFGCRTADGAFDLDTLRRTLDGRPVRAIELKLSQGAKPGLGGVLPGIKVTREIAWVRGIDAGKTCISPPVHSAFRDVDEMLDFVEMLADQTGLPIGIKAAVGQIEFWRELADLMATGERGVDFITVDGAEGGTGAGPLTFTDHVALPFKVGFARVYRELRSRGVDNRVVLIGSGKLGLPENALLAVAMGCDMINVGRTAMLAVGCIQAQRCHTDHCPTGVATQNRWLMRGLEPRSKAVRVAHYVAQLRKELLQLSHACGFLHPALVTLEHLEILDDRLGSRDARDVFGYDAGWGRPCEPDCDEVAALMAG